MLGCIDSLTSENFQMADCFWNHPIMHCEPLIIDYVMYAFLLFTWPLEQVFRGQFGPQVKFCGWNTAFAPANTCTYIAYKGSTPQGIVSGSWSSCKVINEALNKMCKLILKTSGPCFSKLLVITGWLKEKVTPKSIWEPVNKTNQKFTIFGFGKWETCPLWLSFPICRMWGQLLILAFKKLSPLTL